MSNGATTAETSFDLADGVTPSLDCEAGDLTALGISPAWMRMMFDRRFQRMAVTVTDQATEATQISTVDVATGRQGPMPGTGDGFTSTPEEGRAVFHPTSGELWFVDHATWRAMSRDPSTARTTSHGKLPSNQTDSLAVGPEGYFPIESLQTAAVSPDGKRAVVDDHGSAFLARVGQPSDEAPSIGGGGILNEKLPGPAVACGTAEAWVDGQNLLCNNSTLSESEFTLITFSPDWKSITDTRDDLLPETNRRAFTAVASPDGKSFAFVSVQGQVVTLYRQSLTPGSTPIKITDMTPPVTDAESESLDSVPLLLAWQ